MNTKTRKKLLVTGALLLTAVFALLIVFTCFPKTRAHAPQFALGAFVVLAAAAKVDGAAADEDFETEMLNGVKDIKGRVKSIEDGNGETKKKTEKIESDIQKVMNDLDRSDKEVKKALEDLTKVKNTCNDFAVTMAKMEKVQKAVALNARSSFGDPIKRLCAGNDELNAFFKAVGMALQHGGNFEKLPTELKTLIEGGRNEIKSLTGVDAGLGQATVPQATFNEIYDLLLQYGAWNKLSVQRVGVRTTVLPIATARPTAYWLGAQSGVGEGSAITESGFAGGSVNLLIQTLGVYLTVARELLADSSVDMAPYLLRQLVQALNYGLDYAAFNAAGGANQTDGGYTGLFQAALANTNLACAATPGNTTIAQLILEDFVNTITTVNPQVLMLQPQWWMHPQVLAKSVLIRDKNGRPILQTWQEVPRPGSIVSILGYPVDMVGAAPNTDAPGNPVMAFGDPEGVTVGIRQDMELATSDDILFAQNMRAFRGLMRAGSKIKTQANSTSLKPVAVLTLAAQ